MPDLIRLSGDRARHVGIGARRGRRRARERFGARAGPTYLPTYPPTQLPLALCALGFASGTSNSALAHCTPSVQHVLSSCFFFFFTLVTGPRRSLGLKLSDARVYEPFEELSRLTRWLLRSWVGPPSGFGACSTVARRIGFGCCSHD